MGLSSVCSLYGAIKTKLIAYTLAYSLGLGGFISWAISMPFLIVGAVLGFGLFVQGCKHFKAWPMDTDRNNIFPSISPTAKTWLDKILEFPVTFLNDSKFALRSFDRSLLELLSNYIARENSPAYKKWTSTSSELDTSENQSYISRFIQRASLAANLAIKNFIQTRGIPAIAQAIICKEIHAIAVNSLHANKISKMKSEGKITAQDLDTDSTQAAILTMYNYSLSDKGIVETALTAAYSEYKNPPNPPVARILPDLF